jgi:hypothetical protein
VIAECRTDYGICPCSRAFTCDKEISQQMRSNKENVDALAEINLYYFMNLPCKQWELHKVEETSLK